jgi:hypothetical protein
MKKFRGFVHGKWVAAMEVLQTVLPAVAAAGGTTTFEIGEIPTSESEGAFNLESIKVTAPSLVTGATATAGTFNVRQLRAGSVITAVVGTLALVTGVNLPAETPVVIPITAVVRWLPGDILDVQYVQISTGTALPVGTKIEAEID